MCGDYTGENSIDIGGWRLFLGVVVFAACGLMECTGCGHHLQASMVNVEDFSVQSGVSAYRVRDEFGTFVPLSEKAFVENPQGPVYLAGTKPWEQIPAIYAYVHDVGRIYKRDGTLTAQRQNLFGERRVTVTQYSPSETVLDLHVDAPYEMRIVELR